MKSYDGVSVILAKNGAVAGCSKRLCTRTRETDLLKSEKTVDKIHALVLSGGSAFGLESVCMVDYLEEQGVGFDVEVAKFQLAHKRYCLIWQ